MATIQEAREIKRKHSAYLLGLPGVVGVGITQDNSGSYGLLVHVEDADQNLLKSLSERIKDCPVKIEISGGYRKL